MNLALLFCVVTNYANYIYHLGLNVICNGPLGTIHKLRRQTRGRGVGQMPMFAYVGGGEGHWLAYVGKLRLFCHHLNNCK